MKLDHYLKAGLQPATDECLGQVGVLPRGL
jgi:hypothetical protein